MWLKPRLSIKCESTSFPFPGARPNTRRERKLAWKFYLNYKMGEDLPKDDILCALWQTMNVFQDQGCFLCYVNSL